LPNFIRIKIRQFKVLSVVLVGPQKPYPEKGFFNLKMSGLAKFVHIAAHSIDPMSLLMGMENGSSDKAGLCTINNAVGKRVQRTGGIRLRSRQPWA
jgi:hypothetical protein